MANEDLDQTATGIPPVNTGTKRTKKQESWFEVVKTIFYALLIAGVGGVDMATGSGVEIQRA